MAIDLEQFHQVFFEESLEGLDIMEQSLLQFKSGSNDNPEIINTIFRAAHSIKGGSGTFGFNDIMEFTHVLETLLDEARDGSRVLDSIAIGLLLKSCDGIRAMVNAHQSGDAFDASSLSPLLQDFQKILDTKQKPEAPLNSTEKSANDLVVENKTEDNSNSLWKITFIPKREMLLTGNEPARIFRELALLGQLTVEANALSIPELDDISPEDCYLCWVIWLASSCEIAEIKEAFEWVEDECSLLIEPATAIALSRFNATFFEAGSSSTLPSTNANTTTKNDEDKGSLPADEEVDSGKANDANAAAVSVAQPTSGGATTSIRVGIDKVDSLINLVGELVITQSMLSELGGNFAIEKLERLTGGLEQLMQNTRELQESVMRIRMLPISFAFNRFPRMIRDLSEKIGKQVELKLSGEQTELDKTVMEQISDPLVHLVRNAIDHGLEKPAERIAAGKSPCGIVQLNAYHKSGNIVIEISDDGRGIDPEKILAKAIEKGLVKKGVDLSKQQIFDLIFEPGFSTAEAVSDISGRGVGMDVVKRNVKALAGRIEIDSILGKGTVIKVHLPLTLAILDGQLVRVGDEVYVIPLIAIVESLQMKDELINHVSGNMVLYRLREDNVPVIPLHEIFGVSIENREVDNRLLVVVEADGQKMGLLVDDLLAQQQVVIKSLESNYRRVEGVSGATILGDGSVALILDVTGLMALAVLKVKQGSRAA